MLAEKAGRAGAGLRSRDRKVKEVEVALYCPTVPGIVTRRSSTHSGPSPSTDESPHVIPVIPAPIVPRDHGFSKGWFMAYTTVLTREFASIPFE
jgi:hypothetical protein